MKGELVVSSISKHFGGVQAVADASFRALPGRCTGIVGPNGAGKSTVLNLISGAIRPDHGSIVLDGVELAHETQRSIARLGVLRTFQAGGEFGGLSVMENLLIGARISRPETVREALQVIGWKRRERPAVLKGLELLTNLGLREKADQLAGTLSGGERRLLEVARALMAEPSVLLLDEPTAGVHDVLIERLERHIREIVDAGVTVVLVEHELGVVERLCDSIVMMANGSVLGEAASLVELSNDPAVVDAYFG